MTKLSLSKAWDECRAIVVRDGGLLGTVALAFLVLPATVAGAIDPSALTGSALPTGNMLLMWLATLIVGLIGRLAIIRLVLGPSISVGDAIRHGVMRVPVALGALLIFIVPVSVALTPFLIQVLQSPLEPPQGASAAMLVIMLVALLVGVRLILLVLPVAAVERGGPISMLKRSWQLSRGNWWRLAAFVVLFFVTSAILTRAATFVVGIPAGLISGPIKPLTLGALVLALAVALVGAAMSVLFGVMLARIYVQLNGEGAAVVVPTSGT